MVKLHYVPDYITVEQRINEFVEKHGSLRNAAKILGTDASYLSCVRSKQKQPSDKLLFRLGLKKNIYYTSFREIKSLPRDKSCEVVITAKVRGEHEQD